VWMQEPPQQQHPQQQHPQPAASAAPATPALELSRDSDPDERPAAIDTAQADDQSEMQQTPAADAPAVAHDAPTLSWPKAPEPATAVGAAAAAADGTDGVEARVLEQAVAFVLSQVTH
jgi:hypothetical protein